MQRTNDSFGLSQQEVTLIGDIVLGYADESPMQILWHIRRIFAHDMTEAHLIVFGLKLGEAHPSKGAELNTINLSLC